MASYLFSILSSRLGAQDPAHLFLAPHPHPGWGRTPERCLELAKTEDPEVLLQKGFSKFRSPQFIYNAPCYAQIWLVAVSSDRSHGVLVRQKSLWIWNPLFSAQHFCQSTCWFPSISSSNLTSQVIINYSINHYVLCHFTSVFSTANRRWSPRFFYHEGLSSSHGFAEPHSTSVQGTKPSLAALKYLSSPTVKATWTKKRKYTEKSG